MVPIAQTFTNVPDEVLNLLKAHLPTSLPLLRRLQFAKYKKGSTPESKVVLVSDGSEYSEKFTAAYVDYSFGPETQMWLYSTLEDNDGKDAREQVYRDQLKELTREIVRLGKKYGKKTAHADGLLLGTLNTHVRRMFEDMHRIRPRPTGYYDKWLFRDTEVPDKGADLPEGMSWDTATLEDCKLVVERTDIPRTAQTLVILASQVIRLDDGTPISWAFLGKDGSLTSLHCEEPYRRRGLAKKLASRLMRQGFGDFTDDGWSSADVSPDNMGSRGMCKSLNGTTHWQVSWVLFDVTEEGVACN